MLLHDTLFELLAHLRGHPILQNVLTEKDFQLFIALISRLAPSFLHYEHTPPMDLPLDIAQTLVAALGWSWDELRAVWQMSRDVMKSLITGPSVLDVDTLLAQHGVDNNVGMYRSHALS